MQHWEHMKDRDTQQHRGILQIQPWVKKETHKIVYIVWFHLYNVKKSEFVYVVRSQDNRYLCGGDGSNWKKAPGGHSGSVNVLFRDVGAGYTAVFTWW